MKNAFIAIFSGAVLGWGLCLPLQAGANILSERLCAQDSSRKLVTGRSPSGWGEAKYCIPKHINW